MGAGFSSLADHEKLTSDGSSKPGLEDLSESCIALVLTHLDPTEICKFASVNTTFRQASLTDVVWETKLPENYRILVKNLWDEGSCSYSLTKKEMFARLCRPNHFGTSKNKVCTYDSVFGISQLDLFSCNVYC